MHAASEVLAQARDKAPDKMSIRVALGQALFRAGRFRDAAAEFHRVTEVNPADDYAHYGLGLSLQRLGDLPGALSHIKLAWAMHPQHSDYQRVLDSVQRQLGVIDAARARRE